MSEETQPDTQKPKGKKHVILLAVGVATTIIAECFLIRNPTAYTDAALVVTVLAPPIAYFLQLGIVAVIVSAIRRNVKQYWFPTLAWLFLFAGLFDVVVKGYTAFVLRPKMDHAIMQLILSN